MEVPETARPSLETEPVMMASANVVENRPQVETEAPETPSTPEVATPSSGIATESSIDVPASVETNGAAATPEEAPEEENDAAPDVMTLLAQFKDLAAHPRSRHQLIQDATSLGGLVLLLNDQDAHIVEHTLEIFLLLSKSKDCCQALFHQLGFIESLDNIVIEYGDRRDDGANVARMAVQILNRLTARPPRPRSPASSGGSSRRSDELPGNRKRERPGSGGAPRRSLDGVGGAAAIHAFAKPASSLAHSASSTSVAGKKPSSKQRKSDSKTITLQIKGLLDLQDRDECRAKLLEVKGVISLTFDTRKKRAVLRVKADMRAEELVQAVLKTETMSASQVVYDDEGNETLISFNNLTLRGDDEDDVDDDYPEYLSDADDFPSPERGDKAMSRVKGEADAEKGGSWFTAVSSFVKDAFYW